ncbi:PhnD/SsuA/transferrin family substrate-binding protein [Saccharopolyspora sp. NPDC047091]|uniref:ABC transporter substrate-binding protein n=1 Tax=Saccharopolyspora sp. NPDC047091 TaxID=3155924 RepID=UPI0033D2F296
MNTWTGGAPPVLRGPVGRRAVLRGGLAAALGLASAGVLSGCGSGSPGAAKVEDTQKGTAGAVIRPIAERYGLFGDLDLEHVAGTGPGDVQNKLLSGALDVASMGPIGAVVAAEARAEVSLFSTSLNNHVHWLVPENSPYRTVRDLRGKPIATPPNNSDAYRSAQLAAAVNDIDFDADYDVHQGAVLAGLALFDRGDVEAIVTIEPNATLLVGRGARELVSVQQLWSEGTGDGGRLLLNGQGAADEWLDANPAQAAGIARLRLAAHQVIAENPAVLAELHEYYGIPATERRAVELLPQRLADVYPTVWDESVFAGLRDQIDVAVRTGLIKSAPPAEPFRVVGRA